MVPTPMMITYGHHNLLGSRPSVLFIKTWPTWISAQLPLDAYLSPSQPVVFTAPPMTLVTSTSPPIQYHPNTNIKWSPTHSQSAQPSRYSYRPCILAHGSHFGIVLTTVHPTIHRMYSPTSNRAMMMRQNRRRSKMLTPKNNSLKYSTSPLSASKPPFYANNTTICFLLLDCCRNLLEGTEWT